MTLGSNVTSIDSACPVSPVHTSSYEGLGAFPPEYPDSTVETPFNWSKTASVHQKQPAATSLLLEILKYSLARVSVPWVRCALHVVCPRGYLNILSLNPPIRRFLRTLNLPEPAPASSV